jgi:hypothetical protein
MGFREACCEGQKQMELGQDPALATYPAMQSGMTCVEPTSLPFLHCFAFIMHLY